MSDRSPWSVALSSATLTVVVAGAWLVGRRMDRLEEALERRPAAAEKPAPAAPPRTRSASDAPTADAPEPAPGTLASIEKRLAKLADDSYDASSDLMGDVHEIKRTVKQLQAALRTLSQQIARPGSAAGVWGLAPPKATMTPELLAGYRAEAESYGVRIDPGHVEVRGFLNMSPNEAMPIEYFVTRWPESGHETLVHVIGKVKMDDDVSPDKLRGVMTAVYKGLVVAGFAEGQNSGYDTSKSAEKPTWIPPTGDTVYVGVRYQLHGKIHLARATDWVIDPTAGSVLPEGCFRFAGSRRGEDFETGDEQLSAEAGGLLVSVYRNPTTIIEIADPGNLNDNYRYNNARIPKPLIGVLGKHEAQLDMVRDRTTGTLTVLALVRDGTSSPIATAPVLLVKRENGTFDEVPFTNGPAGAWLVKDAAIKTSPDWRVRVVIDGQPVETTGFDPLYVDLIFSKTPIVPEGDGALPLKAIPPEPRTDAPAMDGAGMGAAPSAPPGGVK